MSSSSAATAPAATAFDTSISTSTFSTFSDARALNTVAHILHVSYGPAAAALSALTHANGNDEDALAAVLLLRDGQATQLDLWHGEAERFPVLDLVHGPVVRRGGEPRNAQPGSPQAQGAYAHALPWSPAR